MFRQYKTLSLPGSLEIESAPTVLLSQVGRGTLHRSDETSRRGPQKTREDERPER